MDGTPKHDAPAESPARAAVAALTRPGRIAGMIVAAGPAIVFVAADALSSLVPALIAAAAAAVTGFAWRLACRQATWQALAGLGIVAACGAVAAVTGQERGFFLIPAVVPFAVIAVCLASVAAGRPLTGLILNRVSGGPAGWRQVPALRRVYVVSTLVCAAVNVVNAVVQAVFYLADEPVVLAAAHAATGPVFAVIVAVTVVFARRAIPRPAPPAGRAGGRMAPADNCFR